MLRAIKHIRTMSTTMGAHNGGSIKESSTFKLYVARLPWTIGNKEFTNYFAKFGPITEAFVVFNEQTGISKGYGFVSFQFGHSHGKAIKTEHHLLEGRVLAVSDAS